jgi:cytochrome P450
MMAQSNDQLEWIGDRVIRACPFDPEAGPPDVVTADIAPVGSVYLAMSHSAVRQVLTDPRFSRGASYTSTSAQMNGHTTTVGLQALEGDAHTRRRALVRGAFRKDNLAALRPKIDVIADDLVAKVAVNGPPADLKKAVAVPLPSLTMALLLGLPVSYADRIQPYAEAVMAVEGVDDSQFRAAAQGLLRIAARLLHDAGRAGAGGDGYATALVRELGTSRAARTEILYVLHDLLIGGVENMMVGIEMGLVDMLSRPHSYSDLRAHPENVEAVMEEMLRLNAPGRLTFVRTATEDAVVNGTLIPGGASVLPVIGTANRDARVYENPDLFEADRPRKVHYSFGLGKHSCPGAPLARIELQALFLSLTRRLPGLKLAAEPYALPHRGGHFVDGYRAIPVTW